MFLNLNIDKKQFFRLAALGLFLNGLLYNQWFTSFSGLHRILIFLSFAFISVICLWLVVESYSVDVLKKNSETLLYKLYFLTLFYVLSVYFLTFFPLLSLYAKVVYLVAVSGLFYALLLSINVFIVSEDRGGFIPLIQPARVAMSVFFVLIVFWGSTIIYKNELLINYPIINVLVAKTMFFIVFFYSLFKSLLWYIAKPYDRGRTLEIDTGRVNAVVTFSVISLVQLSVLLLFFPFESYGRGLVLSVTAYVLINFAHSYIRHLFVGRSVFKYVILLIAVYSIAYFI